MHSIFGLSWDEWAAIAAFITSLSIFGGWIFRKVSGNVLRPVFEQLKDLTDNIRNLNNTLTEQKRNLEEIDRRLDEHDITLTSHNDRLNFLEKKEQKNNEQN